MKAEAKTTVVMLDVKTSLNLQPSPLDLVSEENGGLFTERQQEID